MSDSNPTTDKKPWSGWVAGGCMVLFTLPFMLPFLLPLGFALMAGIGGALSGTRYVPARELSYDISTDGKHIIFSQPPEPLSMLDLSTKTITTLRLTGIPESAAYPTLSPDGKFIAFSAKSDLWVASLNGKTIRQLTHDDTYNEFSPRFSPDGTRLVFSRPKNNPLSPTGVHWLEYDVWTIRRDGSNLRQLSRGKYWNVSGAQFSPDGQQILYAAQVRIDDLGGQRQALFEVEVSGKQPPHEIFGGKAHEDGGSYVHDPTLSPDGKEFIILSDHAEPFSYDFCSLKRDGSGFRAFGLAGPAANGTFQQPRFSPDGKHIFYLWFGSLWQMDRNGKNAHSIRLLRP